MNLLDLLWNNNDEWLLIDPDNPNDHQMTRPETPGSGSLIRQVSINLAPVLDIYHEADAGFLDKSQAAAAGSQCSILLLIHGLRYIYFEPVSGVIIDTTDCEEEEVVMEMDEEEAREEAAKAEDFKKLQEEVAAAKPKGTVRAGPPQIER